MFSTGFHEAEYRQKLRSAEDAVAVARDDQLVTFAAAQAEPQALLWALANRLRGGELRRIRVFSGPPGAHAVDSLLALDLVDQVYRVSHFVAASDRGKVRVGLDSYWPNHYHQLPRLISDYLDLDLALVAVSPMDRAGFFTFGTSNDFISTAARRARHLIVEVNEYMPRIHGNSRLHLSEVEAVVENHVPLMEFTGIPVSPEEERIADSIAALIPEAATLQIGVGAIPAAVCTRLRDRRDLGIHTEMLGSELIDLVRTGAVNGARKTVDVGKHVFTVAVAGAAGLDLMHDNPAFESHPVSYTNHPAVIARNDRLVSINAVLEVDLLGQANAESLHGHQFSGSGGQLDFVRGAFDSKDGKSILAFPATAQGGTVSRIVPRLPEGSVVTTPRNDTHFLATEFGVVDVKGKPTPERAEAIIELAHPDFRGELRRAAEDMGLV